MSCCCKKFALLLALCLPPSSFVFAAALNVNGACQLGNCISPDILPPGSFIGSTSFDFTYRFPDTDTYRLFGYFFASESSTGHSIDFMQDLTATFLGNASGSVSQRDGLTADFLQNYNVAFSAGTFNEHMTVYLYGPLGPGSSATGQLILDGQGLPLMGPFVTPGGHSESFGNVFLSGLSNPLLNDFRYVYIFGSGSDVGATIGGVAPEPESVILAGLGLIVAALASVLTRIRHVLR